MSGTGMDPEFTIEKGNTLLAIERIARDPARRDAFLEALEDDGQDYVDILTQHGALSPARLTRITNHLRRHWYPSQAQLDDEDNIRAADPNGRVPWWWEDHQPIEPIIRQGLIRAFREAKNRGLPIDAYWVATGDVVAVSVSWNERQVTFVRFTPPTPDEAFVPPDDPSRTLQEPIVFFLRREDDDIDPAPPLVRSIP